MIAVVGGAAGGVGEAIVRALLRRPAATVVAIARTAERLALLETRLAGSDRARLVPLVGAAGDPHRAAALAGEIASRFGGIDAAIASLGAGFWEGGPLLETEPATWDAVLHEMLTTHFVFARAFLPLLAARPGGAYLGIGGGAAFFPLRDAGIMSIAAAGQAMMTRVLDAETRGIPVRVRELIVDGPIRTRLVEHDPAAARWITADDVGEAAAQLVLDDTVAWEPHRRDGPIVVVAPRR